MRFSVQGFERAQRTVAAPLQCADFQNAGFQQGGIVGAVEHGIGLRERITQRGILGAGGRELFLPGALQFPLQHIHYTSRVKCLSFWQ